MHKELEGDVTRTADSTFQKGYPKPYGIAQQQNCEKTTMGGGLPLLKDWLGTGEQVVSNCM